MIEVVVDRRRLNIDPDLYVSALEIQLHNQWGSAHTKVTLVDHDVLHSVVTDYDVFGDKKRRVEQIIKSLNV